MACFKFSPETRHEDAGAILNAAIAKQIRELRLARGWTQAELAKRSGVGQSLISAMEQPEFSRWTAKTLQKLAAAFDTALIISLEGWGTFLIWADRILCKPWVGFQARP